MPFTYPKPAATRPRSGRPGAACALALALATRAGGGEPPAPGRAVPILDGRSLGGWESAGGSWRIEDGALACGPLDAAAAGASISTSGEHADFILRLRFELRGGGQSGTRVLVRGRALVLAGPGGPGAIREARGEGRVLFPPDPIALEPVLRRDAWNECAVRTEGPRLTFWLNGVQAADFHDDDPALPRAGPIGLEVHGAGASFRAGDITVEALPSPPPGSIFSGAPPPPAPPGPSPLAPAEERATFSLPPGFEIELVLSEEDGAAKPITVVWDHAGRLWTMTALEYPVDANDDPGAAAALYAEPRRDRVLVLDDPHGPAPRKPRVFAEGLAIPLGLLPWKDGAFVQHGTDILFLRDTDGDGGADTREVVLTGFGIGDSHLLPHQFTRAPGGWILVAQGAFNNSRVRTRDGATVEFDRTLLGRFTPDGRKFETIGWGPCNIWGLVLDGEGQVFIQEANDYGYPVMPFHAGACYPGCTPFPKPYAPVFPGLSRLGMGGTGLSGLALSDERGAFPGPYAGVFYVANPVTRRIQAVKLLRDGPRWSLLKLPDFLLSSDEWFRPVAIHFGPDGCLYIADWYNKVISHNEVPRNHPDRDRTRGRIWRVRHVEQPARSAVDFTKLADDALLDHIGGDSLWQAHAAWQEIGDRGATRLAPALEAIARGGAASAARRIQALWALEELGLATPALLRSLLREDHRNIRREAARALGNGGFAANDVLDGLESLAADPDPEVRAEAIRSAAPLAGAERRALALLARMAREPLAGPLVRGTHDGRPIRAGEAYDREFERYLIRATLERHRAATAAFLASEDVRALDVESRLLAALALEPRASAAEVARLLPLLERPPADEEVLRLAEHPGEPGAGEALRAILENPSARTAAAEALLHGRTRIDAARLAPLLAPAVKALLAEAAAARGLALRLASGFRVDALAQDLAAFLEDASLSAGERIAALRALREIGSSGLPPRSSPGAALFARIAGEATDPALREEALIALASAPVHDAPHLLFGLWPRLTARERRASLDRLASTRAGAGTVIAAAREGVLPAADLEAPVLEKAMALLGESPEIEALLEELGAVARPVLRLDGRKEGYVESRITLDGPFTVEAWVRLDPGIGNEDGILGRPGGADFNFHDGRLRVFGGPGHGDRIVAKRAMTAEHWTHVAVARDTDGALAIYLDGELDTAESRPLAEPLGDLDIGRATPGKGTGALIAEFRVWSRRLGAEEIRAGFDRSLEGEPLPPGLARHYPGGGPWGNLHGSARVSRTLDPPPLLTAEEARAVAERLEKYRALAEAPGDAARGKTLAAPCLECHAIGGEGAHIGPNLSGAGAMGVEAIVRSLLTPSAAMEAGYRTFRVETTGDEVLDAFLVSEDAEAVVLRRPTSEDRRILRSEIRRASFLRRSLMPEGLLEAMSPEDVTDLFAYLKTLR